MVDLNTVSIIIPCRNEEKYIARCLDSVIANGYPEDLLEVFVMDAFSDDGTRDIVSRYSQKYKFIYLVDNPKITEPAALNLGIKRSKGEVIIRLDGHTTFSKDYIYKCIETMNRYNMANVGGIIKTLPGRNTYTAKAISLAISHFFGVGLSHFRLARKNVIKCVDTVPFGCFKRTLFDKIGYFDEDIPKNEDIDFNHRIKKAGEKIILTHEIVSYYYARGTLKEFWKHNFRNGYLVTAPLADNKINCAIRHIVPLMFLLTIITLMLIGFIYPIFYKILFATMALYFTAGIYFSIKTAMRQKNLVYIFLMPIMFTCLHVGYGLGSIWGLFEFVKSKIKKMAGKNILLRFLKCRRVGKWES